MQKKDVKIWKYVTGKIKGAFGETNFNKKVIKVDKAKHKKIDRYDVPKKDATLLNTITHEDMHRQHPNMTEKQVRKKTRSKVKKMSRKVKNKLYKKFT